MPTSLPTTTIEPAGASASGTKSTVAPSVKKSLKIEQIRYMPRFPHL
jgi:hypothetical protein